MDTVGSTLRSDRHAADAEWLDYAREQGDARRRTELASHLEAGCLTCAETVRLWRAALDVARRDLGYDPPDALIRQALPEGVRATVSGARQLLYKAGQYAIRLRAEEETGTGRVSLVGQVVDEDHPGAFLTDVTVMIFDGKESIDRTLTNRLGEFAFESAPAGALHLAIGVAENGYLTVALPVGASLESEE